jgi:hypothetical protein
MFCGPGAPNVGYGSVAHVTGPFRASNVAWLRWDGAMSIHASGLPVECRTAGHGLVDRVPRLEYLGGARVLVTVSATRSAVISGSA